MKKFFATALASLVLIGAGVLLFIYPDNFIRILCYVLGSIAILSSAIKFLSAYRKDTVSNEAVSCIILLVLGIVLIVLHGQLLPVIPLAIGVCFLIHGLLKLKAAFAFKKVNAKAFKMLSLSALIGIVFALAVILISEFIPNIIIGFIGALLIFNGIENIFSAIVSKKSASNSAKKSKNVSGEYEDAD